MRGPVHDAGVQLDFSLFVGEAAVANGILVGIVLDDRDGSHHGVERVAAFFEDVHALIEGVEPVGAGDDERTLALRRRSALGNHVIRIADRRLPSFGRLRLSLSKELVGPGKGAACQRSEEKFTA